jgi:hypothetical protein
LGQRYFSSTNNYLSFEHNGLSNVAFTYDGRVGIGFTNPDKGTLQIKQIADTNEGGLSIFNNGAQRAIRLYMDNANTAHLNSGDGSSLLSINENGGFVGIGKNIPTTHLDIEGLSNPSLRITEKNQTGYFEIIGFADSQTQLKHKNETANESSMLDIDAVSNGIADQSIRLFRNSNTGSNGYFRLYNPGTTTENFRIDASNGNAIVGNSTNYTGDIYAYGGDIKLYNSINSSVGYASLSLNLDNSTDDAEAEIRLARTSGTAYLGLELNSKSRDGIRFQTGVSSLTEAGRFDEDGNFSLRLGASLNEFSTDGNLAGNSDKAVPTEKAVKTYVDNVAGAMKIDDLTDATYGLGSHNLFMGNLAGQTSSSLASYNVGIGINALRDLTNGDNNTAIGYQSSYKITTGEFNVSVGARSLYNSTTASRNVAIGRSSFYYNTSGVYNVGLGYMSGYSNTTGDDNVFLGYRAGYSNSTGSNNVFIGYQSGFYETGSNKLYIDNSSTSTPLIKGDFSANTVDINGDLETQSLKVNGDLEVTGTIDVPSGYNGDATKIYITPGDLTFPDNKSTDAWLENASGSCGSCGGDGCASYGGSMNLEWGDDAYIIKHIPRGYRLVGWELYFDNPPDNLKLHKANITNSNNTLLYTNSSSNMTNTGVSGSDGNVRLSSIDFGVNTSLMVNGGGNDYASIQFESTDNGCNNGGHRTVFNGGYLKIEKCSSGCGL